MLERALEGSSVAARPTECVRLCPSDLEIALRFVVLLLGTNWKTRESGLSLSPWLSEMKLVGSLD